MTDQLNETLSALMDDEADELELRRILKEMESFSETAKDAVEMGGLKDKWHRFHLISASLKQEIHTSPSRNLLAGIQAELNDEAIPVEETVRQPWSAIGLLPFIGQGAIAASVALAVLFTADLVMQSNSDGAANAGAELAGTSGNSGQLPGLTGQLNPSTDTRFAVQTGLDEEEMNRLQQVVSEELKDSLETLEVPATFIPQETP